MLGKESPERSGCAGAQTQSSSNGYRAVKKGWTITMTTFQEIAIRDYIAKLKKRAQADLDHKGSPVTSMDEDICIRRTGGIVMQIVIDLERLTNT